MCFFKLTNPGIALECWVAFDSDDESSGHIEGACFVKVHTMPISVLCHGSYHAHISASSRFIPCAYQRFVTVHTMPISVLCHGPYHACAIAILQSIPCPYQ